MENQNKHSRAKTMKSQKQTKKIENMWKSRI